MAINQVVARVDVSEMEGKAICGICSLTVLYLIQLRSTRTIFSFSTLMVTVKYMVCGDSYSC